MPLTTADYRIIVKIWKKDDPEPSSKSYGRNLYRPQIYSQFFDNTEQPVIWRNYTDSCREGVISFLRSRQIEYQNLRDLRDDIKGKFTIAINKSVPSDQLKRTRKKFPGITLSLSSLQTYPPKTYVEQYLHRYSPTAISLLLFCIKYNKYLPDLFLKRGLKNNIIKILKRPIDFFVESAKTTRKGYSIYTSFAYWMFTLDLIKPYSGRINNNEVNEMSGIAEGVKSQVIKFKSELKDFCKEFDLNPKDIPINSNEYLFKNFQEVLDFEHYRTKERKEIAW